MLHKLKQLGIIVMLLAAPIFFFTSCLKDSDETIVLPFPYGKIPYSVIPQDLQDSLRAHGFNINEGTEPPFIEGHYLSSPHKLTYASDNYANPNFYNVYMTMSGQTTRNRVSYLETQGAFQDASVRGRSIQGSVIGKENFFTMYCYQVQSEVEQQDTLWSCKTATVVSGIMTDRGIANCQYAQVVLDTFASNSYYASRLPGEGTYRIFHDFDSLAVNNW